MFHTVLERLCPQGRIPYEKCIPTSVLVCLRSHIGLIKASRKSITKQPYSQYRCAVFTLEGLTVERWGWNHGCVLQRFEGTCLCWHYLTSFTSCSHCRRLSCAACGDGFGRGDYKTDVTPPFLEKKYKLTSSCLNHEMWYYQCLQWNQYTLHTHKNIYVPVCVFSNKWTN